MLGEERIFNELLQASPDEFYAVVQPIHCLSTGRVHAFEVLARGPGGVSPYAALDRVEHGGFLSDVGRVVRSHALLHLPDLLTRFPDSDYVSINVDPHELGDLVDELTSTRWGAFSPRVVVEITETGEDLDYSAVQRLRSFGYRLAVDDFGSGFSNLARLARLRPEVVKADRSLLAGSAEMLPVAVLAAHQVGAVLVVEGVETFAHDAMVRSSGADYVQGFYYSVPQRFNVHSSQWQHRGESG